MTFRYIYDRTPMHYVKADLAGSRSRSETSQMHSLKGVSILIRRCAHECAAAGAAAAGGVFLSYRRRVNHPAVCVSLSTQVRTSAPVAGQHWPACAPACSMWHSVVLSWALHAYYARARDVLVSSLGCSLYECDIPLKL